MINQIICMAATAYMVVIIVRMVFSWIPVDDMSVFAKLRSLSYALTEPLYAPVRRVLPTPGGLPIDFTPTVILVVIYIIRNLVCRP